MKKINYKKIFDNIYKNDIWSKKGLFESKSGRGSTKEYCEKYIKFLQKFITDFNIKSVVDLGCGDFKIGPLIYDQFKIDYTGYDAAESNVEYLHGLGLDKKYKFIHLDFFNERSGIKKDADLYIIKDVLQHWHTEHIETFLDYLTQNVEYKYIITVNDAGQRYKKRKKTSDYWRSEGLNCGLYPLKKYNFKEIFEFNGKQVSVAREKY